MTKDTVKSFITQNKTSIIVVTLLLLISFISIGVLMLTREEGDIIVVSVGNDVIAEYKLSTDGVYTLNGGTNVLTIENGIAYMSYSECKGHHCEKMGKIRYVGEFIECAPNGIKIVIRGSSDSGVDIVS